MPKLVPVPTQKLIKVFQKAGFSVVRSEGDHFVLIKPGVLRPLVVPLRKDVPVFIIRNCLRSAGMSREEYFRLLRDV
jgi:predicted RNA binding protein YcfA (HicA-like mRNA interferase family)